ncbi:MAG TPA: ABC transporter permease, partial [Spirochaetes bacterium]|nr:ABC transporter permease [Spirochaetota bacterium]
MKFELYTALRYLKSKKDNLFISKLLSISILTVALAIMVPIIVLSIVNGFHNSIKEKIIATNFEYRVRHRNNNFTQFKAVLKKIKSHPDVAFAIPFFESQGLIKKKGGDDTFYVTIKGFYNKDITINELFTKHVKIQASEPFYSQIEPDGYDPDDDDEADDNVEDDKFGSSIENNSVVLEVDKNTNILPNNVITLMDTDVEKEEDEKVCYSNRREEEKPIPFQIKDVKGIVIGAALTNNLKASKGDKIELLIPQGDLLYDANPDSMKTLKVTDIYSAGYAKFNKSLVFINFKAISEVFQFKNLPTDIGIHLKKGASASQFTSFLKNVIQKSHSDLILFNTLEESIFKDFDMEKNLMLFLLLFLVGSAFVTIYIAVRIVVLDKRVEIGILKAIGSKSKSIKTIFVVEGF